MSELVHVRPDGTVLPEGQAGVAVAATLNEATGRWVGTRKVTFSAGWSAEGLIGFRIEDIEAAVAALDPIPAGQELDRYRFARSFSGEHPDVTVTEVLVRETRVAAPAILTRPKLSAFIRFAGLSDLYAAAVAAAAASEDSVVVYAADVLTQGTEFTFDGTLAAAGAALAELDLGPEVTVPDFDDPATRAALRGAWDAAAALELPA